MDKATLRRESLTTLKALSPEDRARLSQAINKTLTQHPAVANAHTIAVFDPLPTEPDLNPFIDHLRSTRPDTQVAYPRCHDDHLHFHLVASTKNLFPVPNRRFREPNPETCPHIDPTTLDLILVPGLAFSPTSLARLGRGGGYYDRLLATPNLSATTIGIAFPCQLQESIPTDPHDQTVMSLVTA
ncbi:MAG: 5-formyltetrahydrofolate cyclo-ligase [Verrucomicrobiota bacterium]